MRKYPKYKDSGIEWIGEIPEHWDRKALKYFSTIVLGKMLTPQDKGGYIIKPYLRAKNIMWGKVDQSDINEMWFSENELRQFRLKKNDLLVSEGGEVGRTAIWGNEIDECYIQNSVHKVSINSNNNSRYYLYSFCTCGGIGYFDSIVSRVSIAHLTREKLVDVPFCIPPEEEQQSIADFLDRKTALIDNLIEKKQKQIELLKEQRQAIINQAVTKGLNPKVKMKDSGIEWLGEIPEHWEVKKLKHVFVFLDNKRIPLSGEIRGAMKNKTYDYYGASGIIDKVDDYLFDETLILIGEDGANLYSRSKQLAFLATGKYWVNNHAHILKPNNGSMVYFVNLLEMIDYSPYVTGAAQPKLTIDNLAHISVAVPPIQEQDSIAEFIEASVNDSQCAIGKAEKQILLLQEYRTALISEAVTGKIDVREVG